MSLVITIEQIIRMRISFGNHKRKKPAELIVGVSGGFFAGTFVGAM